MTQTKRVVAISDGVLVPSTRYRVDPILAGLKQLGWESQSIYGYGHLDHGIKNKWLQKSYRVACRMKRALHTATVANQGPVLLQRLAIPIWSYPEVFLTGRNEQVVFDFDDAIFLNRSHQHCPRRTHALQKMFGCSAHVVAGNSWLAEQVVNNRNVTIIPTVVNTDLYCPADDEANAKPIVGWMGTAGNFSNLHQLIEPLKQLRKRHDFEFVICSDRREEPLFEQLQATFRRWTAAEEISILRSFDIGLMPLDDNEWTRGKCSFKLIQYMSVGKPAVASPVGMNGEVIDGSSNGLFAGPDQWCDALDTLLDDQGFRQRMGQQARLRIEQHYSVDSVLPKYDRLFSSLR